MPLPSYLRSAEQLGTMSPWSALVAVLAAVQFLSASAQDFSGVHEITSGPDGAPVICLLLHGASFTSADWSGSSTNTMNALGEAGACSSILVRSQARSGTGAGHGTGALLRFTRSLQLQ